MRTLILVVVLTSAVLAQSEAASSLDAARELYASADYRGALAMLDRLAAADPLQQDPSIDLYRVFCLIALDKIGDADQAIVAMITRDPLYRPADAEVPPVPSSPAATAASRVDAPKPVRIFDSNDRDVVPPVTVKQDISRVQRPVLVERTGVLTSSSTNTAASSRRSSPYRSIGRMTAWCSPLPGRGCINQRCATARR